MKVLAWNLNHRAARRRIPSWIAAAIDEQAPDPLVLAEYVEGPDHDFFLATLNANGLSTFSCSTQPGRENQVLIASRDTQRRYELVDIALDGSRTLLHNRITIGGQVQKDSLGDVCALIWCYPFIVQVRTTVALRVRFRQRMNIRGTYRYRLAGAWP